jgi:hypothetical protein
MNKFRFVSDGFFTLQETKDEKEFFFYRNDGDFLGNIDKELIQLYQAFIAEKMFSGEITEAAADNILLEESGDGKSIKVIIR